MSKKLLDIWEKIAEKEENSQTNDRDRPKKRPRSPQMEQILLKLEEMEK